MKRIIAIGTALLMTATVFAQTPEEIYVISPKVGDTIDTKEKIEFGLFPYYKRTEFQYGIFYQLSDTTYLLKSLVKDSIIKKVLSKEEFVWSKKMIDGFPTENEIKRDAKLVSINSSIDSTKIYFVKLKDGSTFIGNILLQDSTIIVINTSSISKHEILISNIKKLSEYQLYNNAIYGNLGGASIVGVWVSATIYYERILNLDKAIKPFIKGGVGGYALWGEGGFFLLTSYGILTGEKAHHFEISAGVNWFLNGDLQGYYKYNLLPLLSATIGYRYQKPGGHFIFRTGVSTPEGVYFGIGRSF